MRVDCTYITRSWGAWAALFISINIKCATAKCHGKGFYACEGKTSRHCLLMLHNTRQLK